MFRTLQTLGGPIVYGLFESLGNASLTLTAIKSAFVLNILLVYTPLSKFWTTEVKPPRMTHCLLKTHLKKFFKHYFFAKFLVLPKTPTSNKNNKNDTYP